LGRGKKASRIAQDASGSPWLTDRLAGFEAAGCRTWLAWTAAGGQLDQVAAAGGQLDQVAAAGGQLDQVAADGRQLDQVAADGRQLDDVAADGRQLDQVAADGEGSRCSRAGSWVSRRSAPHPPLVPMWIYKVDTARRRPRRRGDIRKVLQNIRRFSA
jgi:hypothetical protein